jgi:hypothetical protein
MVRKWFALAGPAWLHLKRGHAHGCLAQQARFGHHGSIRGADQNKKGARRTSVGRGTQWPTHNRITGATGSVEQPCVPLAK